MIVFWIAAALLSALVALPVLAGAARGAKAAAVPATDDADPTLALHRRQLAEIDDLAARGLLSDAERASARAEAGRRLLAAADDTGSSAAAASPLTRRLAIAGALLAPLIGLAIYLVVGSPGAPDEPFARRMAAWRDTNPEQLTFPEVAAVLEAIGRENPKDPQAPQMLATVRLRMGDAVGAAAALRRAVALSPERADLWQELGSTLVQAAEGEVTDEAAAALDTALARQPDLPLPNYLLGRRDIAAGRVDEGLARWRAIRPKLAGGPGEAMLDRQIAAVEATGKLPPDEPQAEPQQAQGQPQVGPAQIAAMVEGLAARLKANPDDPEGWMRLVRAYTVLGETAQRDAALATARARYKNDPDILRGLDSAAQAPQQ